MAHAGTRTHPAAQAVSRTDAACILGISTDSVDRMVKRGDIAALRYAGRTMIPVSELERLLTPTPRAASTLDARDAWAADHPND